MSQKPIDSPPLRIGAVNYLNTKPLIHDLDRLVPGAELVLDLPSRLADSLATGRLDVALIPSIELFQRPDYTIVSDACIACDGPVLSVKLLSRVPIDQIRRLALDEGSRTSVALVRILLRERFGLEPELAPLPIGQPADGADADATLLIGDRAIHSPQGRYAEIWDLGDQWRRWAELPFVFAMWVAGRSVASDKLAGALQSARDLGLENLEQIAEREAAPLGLTRPQCLAYLRDNLRFRLGPREQEGLELFYQHAARLGLAPEGSAIGV